MHRRILLSALLLVGFSISATAENSVSSMLNSAAGSSLMSMLTSNTGVTQNQAEGGVGSMLKLAEEKLAKGDFDKIAAAIPGASKYMGTAKSLGAFAGAIGNKEGLMSAFSKLGISQDTASKFMPVVENFVGKAAGSKYGNLFKSVFK